MTNKKYFERKSYKTQNAVLYLVAFRVVDLAINEASKPDERTEKRQKFGIGSQMYWRANESYRLKKDAERFINNLPNTIYWDVLQLGDLEYKDIKQRAGML